MPLCGEDSHEFSQGRLVIGKDRKGRRRLAIERDHGIESRDGRNRLVVQTGAGENETVNRRREGAGPGGFLHVVLAKLGRDKYVAVLFCLAFGAANNLE